MRTIFIAYALILALSCRNPSGTVAQQVPAEIKLFDPAAGDTFKYFSLKDSNISLYKLPKHITKPEKWKKAEEERKENEWYGGDYATIHSADEALMLIDTAKEFYRLTAAKSWCIRHYDEVFPQLVYRLGIKKKLGLENTADLIIWERLGTGELQFYGHGGCISEDIFTVAGRTSWILNQLTGENFAVVRGIMSEEQAQSYKAQWIKYINKL